jgi:hypothetical protein
MKDILKQLLTGADNATHDIARWLGALAVIIFLCLTVYVVVVQHGEWKMTEFGIGLGSVFAAIGAFIKLKQDSEPKQ